jgi:hypothetical protein
MKLVFYVDAYLIRQLLHTLAIIDYLLSDNRSDLFCLVYKLIKRGGRKLRFCDLLEISIENLKGKLHEICQGSGTHAILFEDNINPFKKIIIVI